MIEIRNQKLDYTQIVQMTSATQDVYEELWQKVFKNWKIKLELPTRVDLYLKSIFRDQETYKLNQPVYPKSVKSLIGINQLEKAYQKIEELRSDKALFRKAARAYEEWRDSSERNGRFIFLQIPQKFSDWVNQIQENRECAVASHDHFLNCVSLLRKKNVIRINLADLRSYHLQKIIALYAIVSGEDSQQAILTYIWPHIEPAANIIFLDVLLHIELARAKDAILLKSDDQKWTLPVHSKTDSIKNLYRQQHILLPKGKKNIKTAIPRIPRGVIQLEDNAFGKIQEIILVFDGTLGDGKVVASLMKSYAHVSFIIVIPSWRSKNHAVYAKQLIQEITRRGIKDANGRLEIVFSDQALFAWARDYFLQARGSADMHRIFLESSIEQSKKENRNSGLTAAIVDALKMKEKLVESCDVAIVIEGGDMRAIGKYLFLGNNIVFKMGRDLDFIKNEYQRLTGREVIVVGEGSLLTQAIFHIDMFLTFLPSQSEKPYVLVADFNQTREVLDALSPEEYRNMRLSLLHSQVSIDEVPTGKDLSNYLVGKLLTMDEVTVWEEEIANKYQSWLDSLAEWFKKKDFIVKRVPSAITRGSTDRERTQYNFLAYNNALVEVYEEKGKIYRKIYVPTFGLLPIEKELIKTCNKLGYEVILMRGLLSYAEQQGVLNCMTSESRQP